MMGSLRALQEWCRLQCQGYRDVEITNMSTAFRDGLAFCAIIHHYRPELIDFDALSKENVYENNRLAFEVAETQLGIPALLDAEDMVSMRVPDRLSIITYVSQYYNYFKANPVSLKRPAGSGHNEPAHKRPVAPVAPVAPALEDKTPLESEVKRSTLSSTCAACQNHVHLVQRILVDGKLYHRNCFRCRECSSTLLPGSYKLESDSGSLSCKHHFNRPASAASASANHNGRPDLSLKPPGAGLGVQSARIGHHAARPPPPGATGSDGEVSDGGDARLAKDSVSVDALSSVTTDAVENDTENPPSTPPNPFDESEEEEEEEEEETPAKESANNGDLPPAPVKEEEANGEAPPTPVKEEEEANGEVPPTPVIHVEGAPPLPLPTPPPRPVPAPRRVVEPTPPPRPAPRFRGSARASEDAAVMNGKHGKPLLPPKPQERSQSPGSLSGDTPKPKDPPWLALVQSEPRKKPAPPPPPLATPPNAGSVSSLKGEATPPALQATPSPPPANPFDDDDDDEEQEEEEEAGLGVVPPTLAAIHPWYRITQGDPADPTGGDADPPPPSGGSCSRSASPGGSASKKRPAPRAPRPPSSNPALSTESLSSGSDHGVNARREEPSFTKSVSEPYICGPPDPAHSSPFSSTERLGRRSPSSSPPPAPSNTSSAPATPQINRSSGGTTRGARPPPPRPPGTPSPLASGGPPPAHNKRTCKENPFNRKASPSSADSRSRPPKGPRPARPPAPGHGFPLIKRKVQSDQYIPVEDIHGEMSELEKQLDELEQRGVDLEKRLRDNPNDDEEEHLLVDWFTLIHEKHLLVRREAELVYTAKQQNLEERQADVEYELRCLLNKPEKEWSGEDKSREQELMSELVTIIEQRNQIINTMDQDRQREEEEDKLMAAMLKKKDFQKDPDGEQKKKSGKFKPMKVLKRLSHKGEPGKSHQSPKKDKS